MLAGMIAAAAYTTEGARKKVNQDALCVLTAESEWGEVAFAAVCDGVGGLASGEFASSTVISRFATWFERDFPVFARYNSASGQLDLAALQRVWAQLLSTLNEKLLAYAQRNGMSLGTTFTGMLLCQGAYIIGHVGDCRVYECVEGQLRILTEDQTLLSSQLAQGLVSFEEAQEHPHGNMILQAVGAQPALTPEFYTGAVQAGSAFLVCCDGLYRKAPDALLYETLAAARGKGDAACYDACKGLAENAIAQGETDNISAICLAVDEAPSPALAPAQTPGWGQAPTQAEAPTQSQAYSQGGAW